MWFVPSRYLDRRLFAGFVLLVCAFILAPLATAAPPVVIEHEITVRVEPEHHRIAVRDTFSLPPDAPQPIRFWLGSRFTPQAKGATLSRLDATSDGRFRAWAVRPEGDARHVSLEYAGTIEDMPRSPAHGMPLAWVDGRGVYLDGASGWVPRIDGDAVRFTLSVDGPAGWVWISQGERSADGRAWTSAVPQDDIYLLGGPYKRQAQTHGTLSLEIDLLDDDPALSQRYLSVMGGYIDFFSALIGAYPYPRFTVVENRWQTGYGMPGFTLLGSQVLRLPFILHTSLPHEILHNWWGNGVWVDARGGNWSEGLTAYLADHLIKEAGGGGADYRRKLLERYTSFASAGRDIALRDFRARHSDATQAVGYGKMLMLYHMQRRQMGDAAFVEALRTLWKRRQFQFASMDDVLDLMAAGNKTGALSPRWLDTPGAPQLAIESVDTAADASATQSLTIRLKQTQDGLPYPMSVPVFIQTADGKQQLQTLSFEGDVAQWQGSLDSAAVRVDVDPFFDVFRRLDPTEQPASFARLFGAETQWLILPSKVPAEQLAAWRRFADTWQTRFGNVKTLLDSELARLPDSAAFWVLGWDNRALAAIRDRINNRGQRFEGPSMMVDGLRYEPEHSAMILLDTDNRRPPLGFIGTRATQDIDGLARKLPHYSTYGRLIFASGTLKRELTDTLPVANSPLRVVLGTRDPGPPTDPRPPLADQVKAPLPAQR